MPPDTARFLLRFLRDPLSLGAVSPASRQLAGIIGATARRAARNGYDSLPRLRARLARWDATTKRWHTPGKLF